MSGIAGVIMADLSKPAISDKCGDGISVGYKAEVAEGVHTPSSDTRKRKIYCDGVLLSKCFFADENNGIAKCYEYPYRIVGDELATVDHRGVITVEFDGTQK